MDTETLLKYISGELPDAEREEVYNWISASTENLSEFKALRLVYDINTWREDEKTVSEPVKKKKTSFFASAWRRAAVAVSAACLAAAVAVSVFVKPKPVQPLASCETISAPAGKDIRIDLTDGTSVWLNSNSSLTFKQDEENKTRRVFLEGEGYFKVSKDPKHPFIVETSSFDIKVLGTEFDVSAYPGDAWSAALMKGSVAIHSKSGLELTVLKPMTKAVFANGSLTISPLNSDNYLWKNGIIFFDNLTLSEIFDRLSLYYDLQVDVSEAKGLDRRYTGKFRTVDGYEHIFKVLQMDNNFTYIIQPTPDAVTIKIK